MREPSSSAARSTTGDELCSAPSPADSVAACSRSAGVTKPDDDRWRQAGVLATALNALPVAACDLGSGETADIPRAGGYNGPIGVAIGRSGGISGAATDRALTFVLDMPDVGARRDHWRRGLDSRPVSELDTISERFRMTSGNLRRAGRLAGCTPPSGVVRQSLPAMCNWPRAR